MDSCGLGHVGQQSQGSLLRAHQERAEATRRRNAAVAPIDYRNRTHSRTRGGASRMWRRHTPTDEEFSREIQAHIALDMDRLIEDGMPPDEARAAALRAFGNVTRVEERFYE